VFIIRSTCVYFYDVLGLSLFSAFENAFCANENYVGLLRYSIYAIVFLAYIDIFVFTQLRTIRSF